jgi:hypothetical protein
MGEGQAGKIPTWGRAACNRFNIGGAAPADNVISLATA